MHPRRPPGGGTTLAIAVGAVALVLTMADVAGRYVPHTWIQRDGRFYTNVNVTLVEGPSVDQGEFCASWYDGNLGWNHSLDAGWSNVARGADGAHLPKHPILLPLLSTPLFWAFGLHGTLIFNVLLFFVIGAAAFSLARRYGSTSAAAFAAIALPLATGIRDHAYDYHVDVLMLALFTSGLALVHARRGFWAGALIGTAVVLRPTTLIWLPSLLILIAASKDWRTLRHALLGGAIPLVLFAISNHWLYGRPWWSGYNRVLVVVNGEPQIADVSDAFGVPFDEGLEALWSGPYGVRHRLTLMAAALPGLLFLLRKRPWYVLAAILGVAGSVLVFAPYRWYGDRFLWPSCALLVPALAATVDAAGRLIRRRAWLRPAIVAALSGAAIMIAHAALGPPLEARTGGDLRELALVVALFALACAGLTRAAERAGAGTLAIVAPLGLAMLPEVRDRVLSGGPDLYMAVAVCLALGARHWLASLACASAAALIGASSASELDPSLLVSQLDGPAARPIVALIAAALIALPVLGRSAFLLAPLAALAIPRVAGLGADRWPLFALALLALPLAPLALRFGSIASDAWRASTATKRALALSLVGLVLFAIGVGARVRDEPFRIASYEGVRSAEVHLGNIPCDFLAWEHLNWECSTFDHGVHGETGLATSLPLHVSGRDEGLFLIPAQGGRPRTVRWHQVPASRTFQLRWAVPDELRGGGTLVVRAADRELASIALPREPDGLHEETLETPDLDGRRVTLELEIRGAGSAVVVDGGFVN